MAGRPILPESAYSNTRYDDPTLAWRREILRETIRAFEREPSRYHALAKTNVERWKKQTRPGPKQPRVRVLAGDWGEVTHELTKEFGTTFAALNMANAYVPGGAYVEGTAAQEENMFRRSDCHFAVLESELLADGVHYRPEMSALINGEDGRVYLDTSRPRVCVRRAELPGHHSGYEWLAETEVFPFFELRAAARDYRDGARFEERDARRRIAAQLDTLIDRNIRHAVLGASGCGAFRNPSERIARIYREELDAREGAFECVAFAIFHAGYGPGNFEPFSRALGGSQ